MKKQLISLLLIILVSFTTVCQTQKDSVKIYRDSILILNTKYKIVNNEKKDAVSTLAQIIYYEKIINRKKSQKKYEHGWITRALKYYNLPIKK